MQLALAQIVTQIVKRGDQGGLSMMRRKTRTSALLAAVAVVVAAALSACSDSSDDTGGDGGDTAAAPSPTTASATGPASLLPQDILDSGEIVIAEENDYPPFTYTEPGSSDLVGADGDVRDALTEVLGVDVKPQVLAFDSFIPALQAGRVDALGEIINDLPERRGVADFVDFMNSGDSLITPTGSTLDVQNLDDLCGLSIGTALGANTTPILQKQVKTCESKGLPVLDAQVFPEQPAGLLAVKSGRLDGFIIPSLSGGYVANQSNGEFQIGPVIDEPVPGGWVVAKDSPLGPALLAAFKQLYDSGELKQIYDKYGIGDFLIEPQLNIGEAP
jgi:polar amino acid transport system substrate-binding protein